MHLHLNIKMYWKQIILNILCFIYTVMFISSIYISIKFIIILSCGWETQSSSLARDSILGVTSNEHTVTVLTTHECYSTHELLGWYSQRCWSVECPCCSALQLKLAFFHYLWRSDCNAKRTTFNTEWRHQSLDERCHKISHPDWKRISMYFVLVEVEICGHFGWSPGRYSCKTRSIYRSTVFPGHRRIHVGYFTWTQGVPAQELLQKQQETSEAAEEGKSLRLEKLGGSALLANGVKTALNFECYPDLYIHFYMILFIFIYIYTWVCMYMLYVFHIFVLLDLYIYIYI